MRSRDVTCSDGRTQIRVERRSIPITVLALDGPGVDMVRRFAVVDGSMIIASGGVIESAGLVAMVRDGRAVVTAADVVSRTPGCECCVLRVDVIDAIRYAVLRRTPPHRLIVVIDQPAGSDSAAFDATVMVHTILADGEIMRLTHLDGVVAEIDGVAVSTRASCGVEVWGPRRSASIAIADRIVITGSELLTDAGRSAIGRLVTSVNRVGQMTTIAGEGRRVDHFVDLEAWRNTPRVNDDRGFERCADELSDTSTSIETVVLHGESRSDADAVDEWLDMVIAKEPSDLFRLQAALRVSGEDRRVCVHGARSALRSRPEIDPAPTGRPAQMCTDHSTVVLVGCGLDRRELAEGFRSTQVSR